MDAARLKKRRALQSWGCHRKRIFHVRHGTLRRNVSPAELSFRASAAEIAKAQRLGRVMAYLTHAIEAERPLHRLPREDAGEVRDHMLRDLNIKPATVGRYMNDIRVLIAFGITEFGLRDALTPFLRLLVPP